MHTVNQKTQQLCASPNLHQVLESEILDAEQILFRHGNVGEEEFACVLAHQTELLQRFAFCETLHRRINDQQRRA
jgi:hypothetical protein